MPLKTWTDYERLEATDLNSAFAWSQDQTLPGANSLGAGNDTAVTAAGNYVEVRHGAPGTDTFGIWQSGNGRLVIPTGLGGLWLYTSGVAGFAAATAGDTMQVWLNVDGARTVNLGSVARYTGVSVNVSAGTQALVIGAGVVLHLEARMLTSSGQASCKRWSLIRLGRAFGAIGATSAGTLEDALERAPDIDVSLPDQEAEG